ncbi:DUF2167 domain-containing protein [Solitalea longa]|uniref:DUF2167 domain-containing protein n=1 Tax=Solitalea longa TaxID=2079460 RepID=A0A2S5A7K6_9SPHI|nr:DUF2167 domain-containing protein [Solitalea longa]POY38578.1 DUF2167 domain-containing protein [Solitalea longa]
MKKSVLLFLGLMLTTFAYCQSADEQKKIDSIENAFTYQHGTITLKGGIGILTVPKGFKYLDPEQAEKVIVDLWGNPGGENVTLGLLLPENQKILANKGYVFNIQYDEIGYVKDDDADDIDYADLLKEMQEGSIEENKERQKNGYEPITVIGWANQPFYDKENKILHWAKELKFGDQKVNTLNYNVRVLGRKGVLILNAIATMNDLPQVKQDISQVLNIVQFSDGYAYKDFDPKVDEVAAWTIGGLVAGKVLAKVGFFAIIAKFGKIIVFGIIAFFSAIWKRLRGKRNEEPTTEPEEEPVTQEFTEQNS